jgi:DHA1 family bicyclomycin/chloramphenicol resistance-like MFS transporter
MSPNISFLIIMRFIQGASGGAMWTAGRIITVEMFPEAKAKQAFGILSVIFSFGPAIAPIIGGWMVADFSWAGSFYVMIVISIFASILAILYLPETLTAEKQQRINILNTVKNYGFLLNNKLALAVLCAIMLFTTANYIYISASHKFLIDLLGLKPTDFAYLYWPLMIGNVLAGFVNAKFAYRMNSSKVMRIAIMVMSIATISNIILCYSHIQQILLLVIPLAVYTFGVAIILPVLMVELMKVSGNLRGLASALFSVGIFMANSIIASFILPLVWTSTLSLAIFQFVLLLCGVTVMILFFKQKAFINYVEVTK